MSLHAKLSPEAQARLDAQKRNSTISSIVISLLVVLLVGISLMFFLLPSVDNFTPEIVSYQGNQEEKETITKREMSRKVQPKPSSPSSSMAKVIAANVASNIAIPVPETTAEVSLDMGNGEDIGDGWGDGDGWGVGGGGGATFFGQKVAASRVCYVIDYSASMNGKRIALLKKELTKSVKEISAGTQYQLIFFAGPAWLAGNDVKMAGDMKGAVVVDGKDEYKWSSPKKSAHDWKTSGKRQPVPWLEASAQQLHKSLKAVKNTPLVWGTAWEDPLEMALRMDPLPQVIFFMTDGLAGGSSDKVARSIAARAKSKGIQINTIAMMEPRAEKAMRVLSKANDGTFTLIQENGKAVKKK